MHGAPLHLELLFLALSLSRTAETTPVLTSPVCVCASAASGSVCLFYSSVMDGLKLPEAFFFFFSLYLMPDLLEGQVNGSRWSPQTNGLIPVF